jgi:hypothetical protein
MPNRGPNKNWFFMELAMRNKKPIQSLSGKSALKAKNRAFLLGFFTLTLAAPTGIGLAERNKWGRSICVR